MKLSYILIAIGVVIVLGLAGWFFYYMNSNNSAHTAGNTTGTFPVGSSTSSTTGNNSQTPIMIGAQNSSTVQVNDFIHNGETVPDVENAGNYYLAGKLPYCLPNIRCQAATTSDFTIVYSSTDQAFNIALLTEPLGKARQEVEQFLMNRLGLTQQQLCSLNYYIGTTYWINETYDGSNLGFSFCPGATQLPN